MRWRGRTRFVRPEQERCVGWGGAVEVSDANRYPYGDDTTKKYRVRY